MCQYCLCDYRVPEGAIGQNIGGSDYPLFIMKYDNPVHNWYYFLVESKTSYSPDRWTGTNYHRVFNRLIPLNYCPDCGTLLI